LRQSGRRPRMLSESLRIGNIVSIGAVCCIAFLKVVSYLVVTCTALCPATWWDSCSPACRLVLSAMVSILWGFCWFLSSGTRTSLKSVLTLGLCTSSWWWSSGSGLGCTWVANKCEWGTLISCPTGSSTNLATAADVVAVCVTVQVMLLGHHDPQDAFHPRRPQSPRSSY
jgi:hypothetical protein